MALARLLTCILVFLCLAGLVAADETCIVGSDICRCSTSNLTLDLRQILPKIPETTVALDKYDITYYACSPQRCPDTTTGEPSVVSYSLYQFYNTQHVVYGPSAVASISYSTTMCQVQLSNKLVFSLGRNSSMEWTITQFDPLEFEINYGGGDGGRQSIVYYKKGTGSTVFTYDKEDPQLIYDFNVVGSSVAPVHGGGGGGGGGSGSNAIPIGIVSIVLVLGGLVTYVVVGGGIFMCAHRGARGVMKDGFFFTISPCYKRDKYQRL